MLRLDQTMIDNLQTLQDLADELLEVSRSPHDDLSQSTCDNMSRLSLAGVDETVEAQSKNSIQKVNKVCNMPDNLPKIQPIPEVQVPVHAPPQSSSSQCEKPDHMQYDETNFQETVLCSELPTANSILSKDGIIFHQRQSPMKNLRTLLECRNDKITSLQASEIAKRLFYLEGEDKRDIVHHLLQKDNFSAIVAEKYMGLFDFTNITLDDSLRLILRRLALLGETQEREKVLFQFACRYEECNPRFLNGNLDAIHVLVCATALLNTDLHGVRTDGWRRMTSKQFIHNLEGVNEPFPPNLLKEIYRSIKKKPLPWCNSTTPPLNSSISKSMSVHKPSKSPHSAFSRSQSVKRISSRQSPSAEAVRKVGSGRSSKSKTIPRKQGVLWRKAVLESDGNKTVRRKRKWKLFMVALQGLDLHVTKKDASDVSKVSLHHCLAEIETSGGATKRQNAFRLTLANSSSAIYQASSFGEMKTWVSAINRNAALLSAAPLSAGIGSQMKFRRPLMPTASSTLPLAKQLEDQQKRLASLNHELEKLLLQPTVGISTGAKEFYRDKSEFLRFEIRKYEVYIKSLCELLDSQIGVDEGGMTDLFAVDTESLASVCPSEPGLVNKTSPSYDSSDDGGSVEDLIQIEKRMRQAASSPLLPTSSLPNLHPFHGDPGFERFLTSPLHHVPYRTESSSGFNLTNRNNSNNVSNNVIKVACSFETNNTNGRVRTAARLTACSC